MTIRVAVADDHPIVVAGVEAVLGQTDEFEIVTRCSDGKTVVNAVRESKPDVVLLDLRLPDQSGLAVLKALVREVPGTKVVILTAAITEDEVIEALRAGVRGILLKEMAPRLLVECLRKVHSGGQWIEKVSVGRAIEKMIRREETVQQLQSVLTKRELEVIGLVGLRLDNKEIAERLFIAPGTVKIHVHSIYRKLGLGSRVELIRFARDKGLVDPSVGSQKI